MWCRVVEGQTQVEAAGESERENRKKKWKRLMKVSGAGKKCKASLKALKICLPEG